jgi:predicted acyltransferase
LSSITFASTVLLGVMGGHLLRSKLAPRSKALLLLAAGIGGLALGKLTGLGFPIIKHIWTSSFVLYAAGWSYLLLAAFYAVMDLWGYRKWAFGFVVIGMNAIVAYMLGELFVDVMRSLLHGLSGKPGVALECIEAASVFGLLWLGLYAMYRKRIFVRI